VVSDRNRDASNYVKAEQGFFKSLVQLHGVCVREEEAFVGMTIKQKGTSDWLGVLRRTGSDGVGQVCFGNGVDFVGALLGLEAAIAGNRWREDKPWTPG
jgi:hypothetical protein